MFWYPYYRLSGLFKFITALISWITVLALVPSLPKALNLPRMARHQRGSSK